jgi:uncharacterized protein YprB with RNaseH-like and TPR domain
MSVSLQKLRALRREVGSTSAPSPAKAEGGWEEVASNPAQLSASNARAHAIPPTPARPASTAGTGSSAHSIESLRRLLGVRARSAVALPPRGPVDRSLPGTEIAPGLRLVETHLPMALPTATLSLAFAARRAPVRGRAGAIASAMPEAADPRDLLFFDTETTGLAGGTGTRAFMIGAADFHRHPGLGDGLRVRQLLIATMAAEADMLRVFADWLSPSTVLASYNGRCYDAPLLKTRYRLARQPDPLRDLPHVDLLFPSRRRWRGRWENCRLATIEREALGVLRDDDLPGSQAPAAWLQYLRGGSSSLLGRVAAHNHQDVVTLALLMTKLVALHAQDATAAG